MRGAVIMALLEALSCGPGMARGCESDELAPQTRDFLSICTRGFRLREPSSLQSSGLTLRPLEPRSTTPGGRAASESERANRTSLRALLPTKSHASTSEHTSVRREHAQGSIRGPRIRAAATLDTGLRSASGGGGREGRSQARAIGTNRSQNRTNRAVADALCRRGRRGGVRLARSAAPTSRYAAVITPVPTEGQRRETLKARRRLEACLCSVWPRHRIRMIWSISCRVRMAQQHCKCVVRVGDASAVGGVVD